jgi:hypothetical protein
MYLNFMLVLTQPCASDSSSWLYDILFQIVKAKQSFTFLEFFEFINGKCAQNPEPSVESRNTERET